MGMWNNVVQYNENEYYYAYLYYINKKNPHCIRGGEKSCILIAIDKIQVCKEIFAFIQTPIIKNKPKKSLLVSYLVYIIVLGECEWYVGSWWQNSD